MKATDYFNRTSLRQYLMVLLGTFIIALAYILFVSPYKFVPGGVYGISIMI
ncbi:MAG: YitT family protein, partial [Bacteroidales bacterium]|nr:YitT family protein [Bacteroidales bacterium]